MDTFTLVDGVVALLVVISGLLAYARGLTRELLAIAGWVVAALIAFAFAGSAPLLSLVKQIPVIGETLQSSCEMSVIVSFALVFALALVVASLFTPLFSSLVQRSAVGGVDQALGFLFGIIRGILLVAVAFFLYAVVMGAQGIEIVDNSRSAVIFGDLAGEFQDEDPQAAVGWLSGQYDKLTGSCQN